MSSYSYGKMIPTPAELGINTQKAWNVNLLATSEYLNILLTGHGQVGNKKISPMGNAYLMGTGARCKDANTGKMVERQAYVNNIPSGVQFGAETGLMGLIPGILNDLEKLDPDIILEALASDFSDQCQPVQLIVRPGDAPPTIETGYLNKSDIGKISPCRFAPNPSGPGKWDRVNPVTGKSCATVQPDYAKNHELANLGMLEPFQNLTPIVPKDHISQLYMAGIGIVLLGIAWSFLE